MSPVLVYVGAGLIVFWGIAHLFPTKNVVAGFGDISEDNRHVIAMEWITEGVALIFMGVLVALVMWLDPNSPVTRAVCWVTSGALIVLAVVSLFTGFRVKFLPYRLCPGIFTVSAVLIAAGGIR